LSVSVIYSVQGRIQGEGQGARDWPSRTFLIFDVQAPWRSGLSDTVPEREKLGWASLAPLDPLPGVWR